MFTWTSLNHVTVLEKIWESQDFSNSFIFVFVFWKIPRFVFIQVEFELVLEEQPQNPLEWQLDPPEPEVVHISPSGDIRHDHPEQSHHQCCLLWRDGKLIIEHEVGKAFESDEGDREAEKCRRHQHDGGAVKRLSHPPNPYIHREVVLVFWVIGRRREVIVREAIENERHWKQSNLPDGWQDWYPQQRMLPNDEHKSYDQACDE